MACGMQAGYVDADPLDDTRTQLTPSPALDELAMDDDEEVWDEHLSVKVAALQAFLRCRHLYDSPVAVFSNAPSTATYLSDFLAVSAHLDPANLLILADHPQSSSSSSKEDSDQINSVSVGSGISETRQFRTIIHLSLPLDTAHSIDSRIAARQRQSSALDINIQVYLSRFNRLPLHPTQPRTELFIIPTMHRRYFDQVIHLGSFMRYAYHHLRIKSLSLLREEFQRWHVHSEEAKQARRVVPFKMSRVGMYARDDCLLMKRFSTRFRSIMEDVTNTTDVAVAGEVGDDDDENPFL